MHRSVWSSIVRAVVVLVAVSLAALLLLSSPLPALADDSSVGGIGGDFYPLTNTDIRMQSETVQAICYRGFAEYRVDFLFVNTGPAQTLMLGFPFATDPEGDSSGPVAFRAWQDGKPLHVALGQGQPDSYQGYYLHQATFPTGRTMITVTYIADPSATSGERFPELLPPQFALAGIHGIEERYDYWLHTGAGWAGTIGTGVVRYTLADDFRGYGLDVKSNYQGVADSGASTTRPETYSKMNERTYQWVFRELEPTEDSDILLAFSDIYYYYDSYGGDTVTVPPVMGAVVVSASTSNPLPTDGSIPGWEAFDGSPGTSLGLHGAQPWIRLDVQGDRKVREIRIVPGKNDTTESFAQYGRPKTIKVTLSDGTTSVITLADEPSLQKFPISGTAEWARLDILDSYPGSVSGDTYISDVSFGNQPAPAFEPFDTLMAQAPSTGTTAIAPTTSVTTPPTGSATTSATTSVTPSSVAVSPTSHGSPSSPMANAGATGRGDRDAKSRWTVWPIVALAIAGAAFVVAIVLVTILVTRRSGKNV